MNQHRIGLFLTAMAALAWSSSGIFTRAVSADLMTLLFTRGLFSGSAVLLFYFAMEGRNALHGLKNLGWPSLAVALLSAAGMITGIGSLRYGSVADAMVIYATVPFITAGIAYLTIGERTSRSTIIASAIALAGVLIMLLGDGFGGSMLGKGLAMLMTFCMASFSARHGRFSVFMFTVLFLVCLTCQRLQSRSFAHLGLWNFTKCGWVDFLHSGLAQNSRR
jgi:drug/metabolite transporter (DMT)-like permease